MPPAIAEGKKKNGLAAKMKQLAKFAVHCVLAMIGSTFFGIMLAGSVAGSSAKNPWFDVPYSPFLWGSALLLGFVLTRLLKDESSRWVWMVGISWFVIVAESERRFYSPGSCDGCTPSQYLWYSYLSYHKRIGEGLGELVATTPTLNSLSYSLGAILAIAVGRGRTRARRNKVSDPHHPS